MTHLFLTGEKGVGKSTLLRHLLSQCTGEIGGFFTVRRGGSVYLLSRDTGIEPTEANCLFDCGDEDSVAIARRFDALGTAALSRKVQLYVMDELGPHEEQAAAFQRRVLELLDGEIPVLGVVQAADSAFLRRVLSHPKVQSVTVTTENRDALQKTLKI